MEQENKTALQKDAWLKTVLNLEQAILDGRTLAMEQLLAIPEEIRLKSPLLLRAECEDGLLNGRLAETQLLLETALKGFAAQADEASMLAMMGMLGLLYEQAGDRQESQAAMSLLRQEWSRTPEHCSGFVPWALAREESNARSLSEDNGEVSESLLMAAAERFREESRPLWAGFALLDRLLFNPASIDEQQWQLWLYWLSRNLTDERYGTALQEVLRTRRASGRQLSRLPGRYAYLSRAVLLNAPEEKPPAPLAGDIEIQIYSLGAKVRRLLAQGDLTQAAASLESGRRLHRLVSTPATRRLTEALEEELRLADESAAAPSAADVTGSAARQSLHRAQTPGALEADSEDRTDAAVNNEFDGQDAPGGNAFEANVPGLHGDGGVFSEPGSREEFPEDEIILTISEAAIPLGSPEFAVSADQRDEFGEERSDPAGWRIKLFDGIRFTLLNAPPVQPIWKRRKAGELLVYLLLQPGYKANRDQVIERVFGEGDLAKRSNQLYVTLHDLRQALKDMGMSGDPVHAKRGIIAIDENKVEYVDAEAFLALSRVGDQLWPDDREEAVRLYGEALPQYGQLAHELSGAEWLDRMREQMLDRQTVMLKRTAAYYADAGDEARAERIIGEWIALRPDQEEAYEAMIRLCLQKGSRSEAIGWYRRLARMCQEELGIEPVEELKRLLWK